MSRKKRMRNAVAPNIQMAPLIDVTLVLLMFFMITAPKLVGGIKIDTPKGETEMSEPIMDSVIVSIDFQGKIFVEESPVNKNNIVKYIAQKAKNFQTPILIQGSKILEYDQVVKVLNIINKAGYHNNIILTDLD